MEETEGRRNQERRNERRRQLRQARPPTERQLAYERDFNEWMSSFVTNTEVDQGTLRVVYAKARRKERDRQRHRLGAEAKAVQQLEVPTLDEDPDEAPPLPLPLPPPPRPWPLPPELTLHMMEICLLANAEWRRLACVCWATSQVDERGLKAR